MIIYISRKSELGNKRIMLFFFVPLLLTISFVAFFYGKPIHPNEHHSVGLFSFFFICLSLWMSYSALTPSVLIVENGKIVLKGALKDVTYNFDEFREINKKHWQGRYGIFFTDGKSYEFYPRRNANLWYQFTTSWNEKIANLNNEIKNIIEKNNHKAV